MNQRVLFHHSPGRTDDAPDDLVAEHDGEVKVAAASEGAVLHLSVTQSE